jgi:hypothetical protein
VDNNYLDLGRNKSGFIHTLPSGRLNGKWPFALLPYRCGGLFSKHTIVTMGSGHEMSDRPSCRDAFPAIVT